MEKKKKALAVKPDSYSLYLRVVVFVTYQKAFYLRYQCPAVTSEQHTANCCQEQNNFKSTSEPPV